MPSSSISSVGRMPPFVTLFWILKKAKATPKITVQMTSSAERLGAELAELAVDDALHRDRVAGAVGAAVPAAAVAAVGEDADGEHAEGAAHAVDGDGADRVVDLQLVLDEADGVDDEHAGDGADEGRPHGLVKAHGAVIATRPASMPLAIIPGSGLPVFLIITNIDTTAPKAPAIAVLAATVANWTSVAAKVEAALKPNQPNSRMNVPSIAIGMWWPGMALAVPSLLNLPMRGPSTMAPASAGHAADGVHDAGAGEVDVADAEVHGVPGLGEPAAAPGPRREQRVVDGAAEEAPPDEGVPLPPLGHGAGRDRGDGVHEGHHVEEEAEHARRDLVARRARSRRPTGTSSCRCRSARRRAARRSRDVGAEARPAEGERVADEEEADEAEAEDGEVRRHHVGGVLGPAEAGLDEREAGLHEDHEDGADDDPEQVDLLAERRRPGRLPGRRTCR